MPSQVRLIAAALGAATLLAAGPLTAQISTDLIEQRRQDLLRQSEDSVWSRQGGTTPEDWNYELADGVKARQVTFYVDGGTPLYGKIYYPKGFTPDANVWPAVAVGHGINAIAIGIEKFAARFAEKGIVAMAIDYRAYGFSGSGEDAIRLVGADPSTDANPVLQTEAQIVVKRTNLHNVHGVEDFRAAVSYLQGEPGVDPNKIGVWGTSNGGGIVLNVAATDARVKAVVAQVTGGGTRARGRATISPAALPNAIARVRTGQGAEVMSGFSFRSYVDAWSSVRNNDVRTFAALDQVRPTTAILLTPAERDELTRGPAGSIGAAEFLQERNLPAQAIVLPYLTHFQPYSGVGFEVSSQLAVDWFLKYLGGSPAVAER